MPTLSEREIMALMDTMDPDEILAAKRDQLDEAGVQLLEELQRDIDTGKSMLDEYGRQFRAADDENAGPKAEEGKATARRSWLRSGVKLPYWALAASAAVFAVISVLPTIVDWGDPLRTRGRSVDVEKLDPINQELVEVLVKRGEFLFNLGNQSGKRDYHEEARDDLLQAYALDEKNLQVLELLARIYEKLGDDQRATRFLEKWKAARQTEEAEE